MAEIQHPTGPGQLVINEKRTLGITTSAPRANGNIGVQFVGDPYPVLTAANELARCYLNP